MPLLNFSRGWTTYFALDQHRLESGRSVFVHKMFRVRSESPSQILRIRNYCCGSHPQTRFSSNRNRVACPGVWVMQKTPASSETDFGGVLSNPFCASDLSVPGGYADSSSRLSVTSIPRVISPVLS